MQSTNGKKIVVVGAGNVGEAIAYTLMAKAQAEDIVLVDVNQDRAKGAALDIAHGTSFHHQVQVRQAGYEECAGADIIIITAGIARKPGQTRLELAKTNVSIIRSITESIMKYAENPLIIVVSNPADVMTTEVKEFSGLPAHRVIGSGTSLDTARFRYNISTELGVNVKDVQAYIVGEHGDSQVPVWSSAIVGGLPMTEYEEQTGISLDKAAIAEHTKVGGAEVIGLKGATFYGVAMSVSTIVEAITKDEGAILPVAHVLDESFGEWAGVAVSLPCRIGGEGIEKSFRIPMNEEETQAMNHSVEILKGFWRQVKEQ
ncbi:L-lactate dehydrogenase [Muricomes intestini]|jgi:L-lactate dehydrogenase|uniref:L-lactate dehydrogenase n=1 Tax=Muricomes intestini TaxID=1796634 RepID=A0A4R3KJH1_9FIRM|nr:L-lactate dehydrogenase [Muricomes intestini]TCS82857.1 L-lactate dehydrogenase [Muricomes intestini]HAX51885.1 L-lactate dehydrogenase [Lachnospiraceae bacterium]HCR84041.1 L-lactate dehydrogenase [Lachnospiraceae bacterium]